MSGVETDTHPTSRDSDAQLGGGTTTATHPNLSGDLRNSVSDDTKESVPLKLDDIVKVSVTLSPNEPPPTAFDLFYMNFDVEMARVPTHFRMQRWSKRRIANRWKWITSREREAYETKAESLKQQWLKLRPKNGNKSGSCATKVKQNSTDPEKKSIRSTESKHDGKRKRERAREKLIKLIASGESFEESDERALKNVQKMSKEDSLLFHGLEDNKKMRRNKRKKRTPLSPIHIEDLLSDSKCGQQASQQAPITTSGGGTIGEKQSSGSSCFSSSTTWKQQQYAGGPALNVIQRQQLHHHQQVIERDFAAQHGMRNDQAQQQQQQQQQHHGRLRQERMADITDDTRSVHSSVSSSSHTSASSSVASVPLDPRLRRGHKRERERESSQAQSRAGSGSGSGSGSHQWEREREHEREREREHRSKSRRSSSRSDRQLSDEHEHEHGSPSSTSTPLLESITSSTTSSSFASLYPQPLQNHGDHMDLGVTAINNEVLEAQAQAQAQIQVQAREQRMEEEEMAGSKMPTRERERERPRDNRRGDDTRRRSRGQSSAGTRFSHQDRNHSNQTNTRSPRPIILDHISFRKKSSREIQSGTTVFRCVPCTNNYTHTLLFEPQACLDILGLNETSPSSYSSFDIGLQTNLLNEMRDFFALEFGKNNGVLVHEKPLPNSPCALLLVIQFHARDHAFNAYSHCFQKTTRRVDFVEEWFSCAYVARQSYSRSNIGSHCLVNLSKGARGTACRCHARTRSSRSVHAHATCTHAHPGLLDANGRQVRSDTKPCASRNCMLYCCCSLFANDQASMVKRFSSLETKAGDVVLWRGTKCLVECIISEHEVEISNEAKTSLNIVSTSSLTKVVSFSYDIGNQSNGSNYTKTSGGNGNERSKLRNTKFIPRERSVETTSDLDEAFDSHAQLLDGLTVTEFFRNFWLVQGNLYQCKLLYP